MNRPPMMSTVQLFDHADKIISDGNSDETEPLCISLARAAGRPALLLALQYTLFGFALLWLAALHDGQPFFFFSSSHVHKVRL